MSGSIPASAIVNVTPNVLAAGGSGLDLTGLFLTTNTRVPIGTVPSFPSAASVLSYFGASSAEYAAAGIYFSGFTNSNIKPGALLFSQYPTVNVGAYLRGGSVSGLTLAQLQAISGGFAINIDFTPHTASVSFSAATSFSNAAQILNTALGTSGPVSAVVTASISGSTMTVTGVTSGTVSVGQEVTGSGVSGITYITALGTGTGGDGTYVLSSSQTVSSETITLLTPTVTYDSVSGAFVVASGTTGIGSTISFVSGSLAVPLALTPATGAVLSEGAVATTPTAAMSAIVAITQNWVSFSTMFDPDNGSGNVQKLAFAAWANGQEDRYVYVGWDTDITPTESTQAASSFGYLVTITHDYSGTVPIWSPEQGVAMAAFLMGSIASLDFSETNGRATMAFRAQTGLAADVNTQFVSQNLQANGYNFYGQYATANDQFIFLYPGSISGPWDWVDSYVNQVWMTNQFQLALMLLLTQVKSIPYNTVGYAMIKAACQDVINQALNFGAIRAGITLSAAQVAEINNAAGLAIDSTLSTRGWYLQINDASPQVRQARGSPPCTFWYTDGESVQQINLTSVTVQ